MSYIMKSEDVYGLASALGAETKLKGKELFFKYCPYCNGGKHDRETFSVNLETGAFKCFRYGCQKQGHFVQLARDFDYKLEFEDSKPKKYRALPQIEIKVRDKAIEYLASRGISEVTARRYRVTTQKNKDNILTFPFYDENNILTCVKYRKTDFDKSKDRNKEWFEADTKPILFGMAQCENKKRLVITEGQIDSLSVADSGIKNAVSVPTGACGFTWVKHCYDWVDSFSEIVIFGDSENGRITLVDKMTQMFPRKHIKVVRQQDYLGEKDANDILQKYGAKAVRDCVNNAEEIPVNAVKKLSEVKAVNLEELEHIRTGIYDVDKHIGGIYMGQVMVITGKRGEGKSTLASQIVSNALDQTDPEGQPYSVFIYSGELPDYHFKRWIDLQIAGKQNITERVNEYGNTVYDLPQGVTDRINAWYDDRAYIFDNTAVTSELTLSGSKVIGSSSGGNKISLLGTIEQSICRYNTKLILIDNLMTALDVDLNQELYRAQSDFVNAVKLLAVKYNVAVILIAHPRKTSENTELNADSVSGSADITNRVDIVLTYSKNTDAGDKNDFQSKISIVKNRLTGDMADKIKVRYSQISKRIGCNDREWNRVYKCFEENVPFEDDLPPF